MLTRNTVNPAYITHHFTEPVRIVRTGKGFTVDTPTRVGVDVEIQVQMGMTSYVLNDGASKGDEPLALSYTSALDALFEAIALIYEGQRSLPL